jgi:hypothetical protein
MFFLDGVYVEDGHGKLRVHRVKAPNVEELKSLVHVISHRVVRFLEKRGFLERDGENNYLALKPSLWLLAHSRQFTQLHPEQG